MWIQIEQFPMYQIEDIKEIINLRRIGYSFRNIADKFKVSDARVCQICKQNGCRKIYVKNHKK